MKRNLSRVVMRAAVRIRNAICNLITELMSVSLRQIAEEDRHKEVGGREELENERETSFDRQDMASLIRLRKENSTEGFAPRKGLRSVNRS